MAVSPWPPVNTLRPRQNGRHFPDNIFKCIFLNENVSISIKIPLKFLPKGPINNIPALVQIMAWHRSGDKPLSEPMMVSILTHICITRPQWVRAINKNMLSLFSNHNSQGPSNLHSIRLFLLFTKNYMPKVHFAMVFELLIKISKKYACFLCKEINYSTHLRIPTLWPGWKIWLKITIKRTVSRDFAYEFTNCKCEMDPTWPSHWQYFNWFQKKFDKNLQYSGLKCAQLITTEFFTCQDSVTDVKLQNSIVLWSAEYIMNKSITKFIEFRIRLKYR